MAKWAPYVSSAGDEAVELAASAGLILDPWQRFILKHALGERADGRWSSFRVSVWVPRQNGKGSVIEARELAGLFLLDEALILHSAHEYKTAQEAFLRIRSLIENTPDLDRLVNKYWQANGEQGIELKKSAGGNRLRFIARSRGSGRGFSGDLNILDEAQELTTTQMAALMPTMSARPNPQIWFLGTPPDTPGAWVYGLRADGEAGAPRMAHFDWGADLDLTNPADRKRAVEDVDLWYACNPSLGIRIEEDFVRDEAGILGDRFAVERLGVWPPVAVDGPRALEPAAWEALTDRESRRSGGIALALDITPSRDSAVVAVYGLRADGLGHVEVVDQRPGTEWIVSRILELRDRHSPLAIALDPKGPAVSVRGDLERAGIVLPEDPDRPHHGALTIPTTQDVAAACGQFADAVRQASLRHIGQDQLTAAVRGAKTRPLGDAWAWARTKSTADISPLVAATLARWAFETRAHLVVREYEPLMNIF